MLRSTLFLSRIRNKSRILTHRRLFTQEQKYTKESWVSLGLMLSVMLTGTYYITSDHFLSQLVRKVLNDAQKRSQDEEEQWSITFKKAEGCFLCGGMRFNNVQYIRTKKAETISEINLETVAVYMDMLLLLKRLYWDKSGTIVVPRFAAVNVSGTAVPPNPQLANQKFNIIVANTRLRNVDLQVKIPYLESLSLHINDLQSADSLELDNLVHDCLLKTEMDGTLQDAPFSTQIEGIGTPVFKNTISVKDIPTSVLTSYYKQLTGKQSYKYKEEPVSFEVCKIEDTDFANCDVTVGKKKRETIRIEIPVEKEFQQKLLETLLE